MMQQNPVKCLNCLSGATECITSPCLKLGRSSLITFTPNPAKRARKHRRAALSPAAAYPLTPAPAKGRDRSNIVGYLGTGRCTIRCRAAKGNICVCQCKGKNHGTM